MSLSVENVQESSRYEEFETSCLSTQKKHTKQYNKALQAEFKKTRAEKKELKGKITEMISNTEWEKLEKLLKSNKLTEDFINKAYDNEGNTLLHLAAADKQKEIFRLLLEKGANPCLKNSKDFTAYQCAGGKEIRRILKRLAKMYPDKYDYEEAGIVFGEEDSELTLEQLEEVRKVEKQKDKLSKMVEKKKEKMQQMAYEGRYNRSIPIKEWTDRVNEKLNKQTRIADRCPNCGVIVFGNTPFEYLGQYLCKLECFEEAKRKHSLNA